MNKSVKQIECRGMILVLIVGLVLVICNLLFAWKFNTWSYETWNYNPYYNSNAFSNLIFMNILLHLPGIAGLWMMVATIIFLPQFYQEISYKVILDLTPPMKMIGFIVPNQTSKRRIASFAVSVNEVERITGYDFFSQLDDELENSLEANIDIFTWK